MVELIIEQDGFIGGHLCTHLPNALRTTRRRWEGNALFYDMLQKGPLPCADVVYICAGVNGNLPCAREPSISWRTNVDGTIHIADHFKDAFVVWISSAAVEWSAEIYGSQKRIVETYLRALPNVAIVRAGRVLRSNVDILCAKMIALGRAKQRGVFPCLEDTPFSALGV